MSESLKFSTELLNLASRAGYTASPPDSTGAIVLWSNPGGETRYYTRERADGWFVLTRASQADDERSELCAVSLEIVEHYLSGQFGVVLRGKERLPYLMRPWTVADIAEGYSVTVPNHAGCRALQSVGGGRLAEAHDPTESLLILIPLSHYLQFSLRELELSFLSEDGRPLLVGGRYSR